MCNLTSILYIHVVKNEVEYQPWKPCRIPFHNWIFVRLKRVVFIGIIIVHFEKIGVMNITFVYYSSLWSQNDQFDGTLSLLFLFKTDIIPLNNRLLYHGVGNFPSTMSVLC